jgi:hypothetical protein
MPRKKKEVKGQMSSGATFEIDKRDEVLAVELGVDLDHDIETLLDSIADKTNRSARLIVEVGLELLAVKRACNHGEFLPLLESRGLARDRAADFMRYAKFSAGLSKAERTKVLGQPKKKVLALASADAGVVKELLADGETFDAVTALSPTEMRRKLKAMEGDKQNAKARIKLLERDNRQLRNRQVEGPTQPYPEYVTVARREANALAEKARLCLDDLTQIHADHKIHFATQQGDERLEEYWEAGAAAIYHNTKAIVAQAVALIAKLEADLPRRVTGKITGAYLYTDEDVARAIKDRDLLVQVHTHEQVSREIKQKGPKRPRKKA